MVDGKLTYHFIAVLLQTVKTNPAVRINKLKVNFCLRKGSGGGLLMLCVRAVNCGS